jgi:hypothetical protein
MDITSLIPKEVRERMSFHSKNSNEGWDSIKKRLAESPLRLFYQKDSSVIMANMETVLDILKTKTTLRSVTLLGGVYDRHFDALVELIKNNPQLRSLNLRENKLMSNDKLFKLLELSTNKLSVMIPDVDTERIIRHGLQTFNNISGISINSKDLTEDLMRYIVENAPENTLCYFHVNTFQIASKENESDIITNRQIEQVLMPKNLMPLLIKLMKRQKNLHSIEAIFENISSDEDMQELIEQVNLRPFNSLLHISFANPLIYKFMAEFHSPLLESLYCFWYMYSDVGKKAALDKLDEDVPLASVGLP